MGNTRQKTKAKKEWSAPEQSNTLQLSFGASVDTRFTPTEAAVSLEEMRGLNDKHSCGSTEIITVLPK